ncbi:hypothetical protein BCIN_16g02880 [Botrytis cinerea B05.10]|uniref:Proteasome assembly chaperone 3 n=1 Tax=Botryotinia fuckeliana (strain B05.10) TaxID=332648 RepID=A0A384K6T8_BOTFB|nr:hypothetical protein BCIN_16g02880 [Botrytis cinerea B05.10]ATZ58528.1 hypothetical protein BCIN_16g02880 [Botrytis cinerea B05.10]
MTALSTTPNRPLISEILPSPFPARSKTASANVNGMLTHVTCMYFADKILITISQGGRLGQWVQIPLTSASPTSYDTAIPALNENGYADADGDGNGYGYGNMILPLEHLTPRTLLGAGGEKRERIAHLYASQIGSMVLKRDPEERRSVLLGLGLEMEKDKDNDKDTGGEGERAGYFDLLELVLEVL